MGDFAALERETFETMKDFGALENDFIWKRFL